MTICDDSLLRGQLRFQPLLLGCKCAQNFGHTGLELRDLLLPHCVELEEPPVRVRDERFEVVNVRRLLADCGVPFFEERVEAQNFPRVRFVSLLLGLILIGEQRAASGGFG